MYIVTDKYGKVYFESRDLNIAQAMVEQYSGEINLLVERIENYD